MSAICWWRPSAVSPLCTTHPTPSPPLCWWRGWCSFRRSSPPHLFGDERIATTIALIFGLTFISGLFQCLFAMFRLGNLTKYIPLPVLSGLVNGSALLIILAQLPLLLDTPLALSWEQPFPPDQELSLLTPLIGVVVIVVSWRKRAIFHQIPAPLVGIFSGCLLYYLLQQLGFDPLLGPVIGTVPHLLPAPRYSDDLYAILSRVELWSLLVKLLPLALGMAAINSLRTLTLCSVCESLLNRRIEPNRELLAQGLANLGNGLFGGIATAGSISGTLPAYHNGGRKRLTMIASGLFPLLILLLFHPVVSQIPTVVLAAL
ncbi:MAG: SulP family inorganic anion transporter, partial [Gammaproteobacteria bacterium]|nr:SulP family inorganic anion transporter [Gammaproteobacteria bacterium]